MGNRFEFRFEIKRFLDNVEQLKTIFVYLKDKYILTEIEYEIILFQSNLS